MTEERTGVSMSGRGGGEWLRGACEIGDDGAITFDTNAATTYRPAEHAGLALDLANVRSVDDVGPFVERWGVLHHGTPGEGEVVEVWTDWQQEATAAYGAIRLAALTREAVAGDVAALDEIRDRLGDVLTDEERAEDERKWLLRFASMVVAHQVDERLQPVGFGLEAEVGWRWEEGEAGVFLFAPRPVDLVGHAFYDLSMLLVNRVPSLSCDECGRMFNVTHHRQRFCNEKCAQRNRYRRWSDRQKAKKGKG